MFDIYFWGVRGSIPCSGDQYINYGGDTSCVSVFVDDLFIIFDAGTGIRNLGKWVISNKITDAFLFFSHVHLDHIMGFPFFHPMFHTDFFLKVMAADLINKGGISNLFNKQFNHPYFPINVSKNSKNLSFIDFSSGCSFNLSKNVRLFTSKLNHPGGSTGYRLEAFNKSICYVTDTEHLVGKLDNNVLSLINGADLVIYDSQYTNKEFALKIGWGHSTWMEAIKLCRVAEAKKLILFHHNPDHTDNIMDNIATEAFREWPSTFVAKQYMKITV